MQPFLNMQFVEFDRERREGSVSASDPDGFFPEQHGVRPDPVGRIFIRYLDWVENVVRSLLERREDAPDQKLSSPGMIGGSATSDPDGEGRPGRAA